MQRDRLHRRAAVAAVARAPADHGVRHHPIQVHADDALDGVDQRQPVRPRLDRRDPGLEDVADVRRQLNQHRHGRVLDRPAGHRLEHLGLLPDRRPHAAFAHAVRAAEVELDPVRAVIDHGLDDVAPVLPGLDHQRRDQGMPGVLLLHLAHLAQVDLERPVGDQLDVVEAHHALATDVE